MLYADLKNNVANWLDRDDLTTEIDIFIDLVEAKLGALRIRAMLKRATATLSTSTKYMALPSGYKAMKILRLTTDPVTVLEQMNEYELTRVMQNAIGKPTYFAIHEEIEFDRVPDSDYSAELVYYAALTALSDSNTSNWILANAPDLYLFGTLCEAEPFLDNDERIAVWKTKFEEAWVRVQTEDRASRTSGPQVARTSGPVY